MLGKELPDAQLRSTDSFHTKVAHLSTIIIDHKLKFISINVFTGMESSASVVYTSSVLTIFSLLEKTDGFYCSLYWTQMYIMAL